MQKPETIFEHLTCGEGRKLERGFDSNQISWSRDYYTFLSVTQVYQRAVAFPASLAFGMMFLFLLLKALFIKTE